ncbi:MAG: hypothetical protein RR101_01490 [Burkholderiaceae bacterium]
MPRLIRHCALATLLAAAQLMLTAPALAETVTVVGAITQITVAPDGKSAVAVLKSVKTGAEVTVQISDDETLDKFKDKRIVEGDEIRTRYDNADGKSKSFRKTAGC